MNPFSARQIIFLHKFSVFTISDLYFLFCLNDRSLLTHHFEWLKFFLGKSKGYRMTQILLGLSSELDKRPI